MKGGSSMEVEERIKELTKREISLTEICIELRMNAYEVLAIVSNLRDKGINITTQKKDDDIYMFNRGEKRLDSVDIYQFHTDSQNKFKFIAVSDTRFGSVDEQLSILNDIYMKGYELGYDNAILCGNISEGIYSVTNPYAEGNFLSDTLTQVDYIIENYPYIEGMKTYFITGPRDERHLSKNKINIGKRISEKRDDMIYLGDISHSVMIDKAKMLIFAPKLAKTYTVSYRAQQQIDSFRSEDKPDILLYGGLLQMEKFTYRNVQCITVPSVCRTTKEMNDKRYSNTVGAWYITVETDRYGNISKLSAIDSVYYKTRSDDYKKAKVLRIKNKKNSGDGNE